MGDELFERVLSWAVPFLLGTVAGWIVLWLAFLRAFRDGLQCLLRAEIIRQNEKWVKLQYCPVYAKQALMREYKAYAALKGNDVATSLYHEVMDLPERNV